MTARPRFLYAFLLVPVLLGAKEGKKGCCGKEVVETETVVVREPEKVEEPLKVSSIEPSQVRPNVEQSATLFGANLKDGAKVEIGGQSVAVVFKDSNTLRLKVPGLAAGSYDVNVTNPDGGAASLRKAYTVKAGIDDCKFVSVKFGYDQSSISGDANTELQKRMTCYKQAGSVSVEGHADERGTTEYNLALGERRAQAVKTTLTNGGISGGVVKTVSYGEERPAASGHDEGSWAQNRRADVTASE